MTCPTEGDGFIHTLRVIHAIRVWTILAGKWSQSIKSPGYDIKPSNGEALALEIWEMGSTPSLPLLSGSLRLGVVAPDRVLSKSQIEQTMCANKWLMLYCDCYIEILETI